MTDNYEHTSSPSWEEQLRSQLAHAEAEPPADLWADIERDLAVQEGAAAKKGRVVPLYARLAGAAAVAALVVGIGLWRMLNTNDEQILEKPCAASSAALRPLAEHVKPIAQSLETSKKRKNREPNREKAGHEKNRTHRAMEPHADGMGAASVRIVFSYARRRCRAQGGRSA